MCLSIAVQHPDRVLATGTHAGHEWVVTHSNLGYRCGYVKVEPGHPWHGKSYHTLRAVRVHGKLTFSEADEPCANPGGADNGWWLGFDAGHGSDQPDPALPRDGADADFADVATNLSEMLALLAGRGGLRDDDDDNAPGVRTQEYVEANCRALCEQAARVAPRR